MANAPLCGTGWRLYASDLRREESEKFLQPGLDSDLPVRRSEIGGTGMPVKTMV
jgi:hypothetical protein